MQTFCNRHFRVYYMADFVIQLIAFQCIYQILSNIFAQVAESSLGWGQPSVCLPSSHLMLLLMSFPMQF